MSYNNTAGRFYGDLLGAGNEATYPIFLASYFKYVNHPINFEALVNFGKNSADFNDSVALITTSTDGNFGAMALDSAGAGNALQRASSPAADAYDGLWMPVCALITSNTAAWIRLGTYANYASATPTWNAVDSFRYLSIGRYLNDVNSSTFGAKQAEVVIAKFTPTAQEIQDYMNGIAASTIWSGRGDYHYFPLDTENATQADAAGNGNSLTASGTIVYDEDHPDITGGVIVAVAAELRELDGITQLPVELASVRWAWFDAEPGLAQSVPTDFGTTLTISNGLLNLVLPNSTLAPLDYGYLVLEHPASGRRQAYRLQVTENA